MAESFLESQLQRIRALTERVSQLQSYVSEFRSARFNHLSVAGNPLCDARDYRMLSSLDEDPDDREAARPAPSEPPRRRRRHRR